MRRKKKLHRIHGVIVYVIIHRGNIAINFWKVKKYDNKKKFSKSAADE